MTLICLPDFSAAISVSKTSVFDKLSVESTLSSLSYQQCDLNWMFYPIAIV